MKRIIILLLAAFTAVSSFTAVYAEEQAAEQLAQSEYIFDDCADFSKSLAHSDGLTLDVVTEENKYAFSGDDTHIIRVTDGEEWLTYAVDPGGYYVFNTCFTQAEAVSDFKFEYSEDNETWTSFIPIITRSSVESYKWAPVSYSLKKLPDTAKYVKLIFQNIGGTPWSPCLESVELRPYSTYEKGFTDCVGTKYYEPTCKLKALGLVSGYTNTEFKPEGTITRAEFCAMTAKLLGLSTTLDPNSYEPIFNDVDSEYWGAGAIYAMYGMGVINGDENKNFNPDAEITFRDAVKIIVSVLGYGTIAEAEGGYPSGYLVMADRLRLRSGLEEIAPDELLIRGDSAIIMDNSLDVEIMRQVTYGGTNSYETDGSTVLSVYHDIYETRGVITEADGMSVYAVSTASTDELVISGTTMKSGDTNAADYLGMKATVYVCDDSETLTALYIEPDTSNKVTEIDYNDYLRIDGSALYYNDPSGRERHIALSGDTKIIYNGRYDTRAALIDNLELKCGSVKVISNNGGAADYIMVTEYETYFTLDAARLAGTFNDKYNGAVNLGLDSAERIILTNDGDKAEYTEEYTVPKDTVVCVAKSRDGMLAEIRVLADTAYGNIENVSDDECNIGGHTYKLSEYFKSSGRTAVPGDKEITAYLDVNNNIVTMNEIGTAYGYGYLQAVEAGGVFSSEVGLRIVTETGKAIEVKATGKSALNGEISSLSGFSDLTPQLVRFSLKADGTVASLDTAINSSVIDENSFTLNYSSDSAKYYGDGLDIFASKYRLNGETKVFVVPKDGSDIKRYEVCGLSRLLTDTAYSVELYDLTREYNVGAAVIRLISDSGDIYNYSAVGVIESAGTSINEDGDRILSVFVYVSGMLSELKFPIEGATDRTDGWIDGYTPRDTASGKNPFSTGEVIQFSVKNDLCSAFRVLLTKEQIDNSRFAEHNLGDYGALSEEQFYSELYTSFGRVENKFADKIFLVGDAENNYIRSIPLSAQNVYIYNRRSGAVTPGDNTDIEQGDAVFVYLRYATVPIITVIR